MFHLGRFNGLLMKGVIGSVVNRQPTRPAMFRPGTYFCQIVLNLLYELRLKRIDLLFGCSSEDSLQRGSRLEYDFVAKSALDCRFGCLNEHHLLSHEE